MSAAHDDSHGHDDHGHAHSPFIQHHYDDAQHQFDSGKLGIWLFLAQEVLFFSALFVAYILYRHHHPEIYAYAHKYLDVKFGAINTAVLIFSSLTAAWAVRAAQLRQQRLLVACLGVTILCALTFLGIKYVEYTHKIHEHLLPGRYFDPCVAANESPLLTRNNECPGSKGSVVWDYEKSAPQLGCVPTFAIDQDLNKKDVQPRCKVREVDVETIKIVKDGKSELATDPDSNLTLFLEKEATAKPVAKTCIAHAEGEQEHGGEECWKVAYQPAVCRPGWFYSMRCTAGAGLQGDPKAATAALPKLKEVAKAAKKALDEAKASGASADALADLTVATDDADFLQSDTERQIKDADELKRVAEKFCAATEKYSYSQAFNDLDDCRGGGVKRGKALKAIAKAELRHKCMGLRDGARGACITDHTKDLDVTAFTQTECVRSDQVGFVVEHHNHEETPAERVVSATCEPPPKPGVAPDIFAEKQTTLATGVKAAGGEHVMTPHEEHEELYGGPPPEHTGMFFTIYFAMTGLHGIHVLVGVFVFIWLLIRATKGHFTPEYFGPVDWAALYWHIVDLIWIFLFPLMYLIH